MGECKKSRLKNIEERGVTLQQYEEVLKTLENLTVEQFIDFIVPVNPYDDIVPGKEEAARKRCFNKLARDCKHPVLRFPGLVFIMHDCGFSDDEKRVIWKRFTDNKLDAHNKKPILLLTVDNFFYGIKKSEVLEWVEKREAPLPRMYKNIRNVTRVVRLDTSLGRIGDGTDDDNPGEDIGPVDNEYGGSGDEIGVETTSTSATEARNKIKISVGVYSQRAVDNPKFDINRVFDKVEAAAECVPQGRRDMLSSGDLKLVSQAEADATGGDSEAGIVVDGTEDECTIDVSNNDTHTYSEPEDDSDREEKVESDVEEEVKQVKRRRNTGKAARVPQQSQAPDQPQVAQQPQVRQEPQESLPEWKDWSAEGKARVDSAKILKTLVSTVYSAIVCIFGLGRGWALKSGAQPQSSKDVQIYLNMEKERTTNHKNDTYKEGHDALAEKIEEAGIDTEASRWYRDKNYAIVQVMPIWLCCLVERLRRSEAFGLIYANVKEEKMFRKLYGNEIDHDDSRTMINCAKCGVLWILISSWVTLVLAAHGFLMVVGSSLTRTARVVTFIESKGGDGRSVQSWHEDFCNCMSGWFGHEFGFSVLVSCLGDSVVDVVEETYGQPVSKDFEKKHFVKVHLKQGQGLIMGSGLRHRGMAYSKRNVRLFIAFLAGKSNGASFGATYNVQSFKKGWGRYQLVLRGRVVEHLRAMDVVMPAVNEGSVETSIRSFMLPASQRIIMAFFECDECSYSSNSSVNLYSHQRSHNSNKKLEPKNPLFGCEECSFIGTSSGALQKHMRRSHEVKAETRKKMS